MNTLFPKPIFTAAALALLSSWGYGAEKAPNILLITMDDQGLNLGCFGDKQANSPNIDRLASEGVRFENAWVSQSSCSPSRSSILTGLYPHQNGQIGIGAKYRIKPGIENLPGVLKGRGYRTALVGKYHVWPAEPMKWDVFREYSTFPDRRDPNNYVAAAKEFLDTSTTSPFFLMVNFTDPHKPFVFPVAGLPEKIRTLEATSPFGFLSVNTPKVVASVAGYYNCSSRGDTGVGMMLDLLKKNNLEQNTIVMYLGDNGPPFTRSKTSCYEAGLRTPLIVKWPGRAKAGMSTKALVSTIDIMPTLANVAGGEPPKGLPGKSLIPLLENQNAEWRTSLFGEHNLHMNDNFFPRRAVRDQRYKLIMNLFSNRFPNPTAAIDACPALNEARNTTGVPELVRAAFERLVTPPPVELYDLEKDPNEFVNLAEDPAYKRNLDGLLAELRQWRESTNDPLLNQAEVDRMARDREAAAKQPGKNKKNKGKNAAGAKADQPADQPEAE